MGVECTHKNMNVGVTNLEEACDADSQLAVSRSHGAYT